MAYMGKEYKREWIYIYMCVYLMYFAIRQKVIKQHFAMLKAEKVFSTPDAGFRNSDMSRRGGFNLFNLL